MRRQGRSSQTKRRCSERGCAHFVSTVSLGIAYVAIAVLLLLNGFFAYSLSERLHRSTGSVSEGGKWAVEDGRREDSPIRVEVLNGAGARGIAQRMTDFLRRQGFDVINFGNAENFGYYETVVLDRTGDRDAAGRVALTVRTENIVQQKNPFLALDVTLVLGRDYRKLVPFRNERR